MATSLVPDKSRLAVSRLAGLVAISTPHGSLRSRRGHPACATRPAALTGRDAFWGETMDDLRDKYLDAVGTAADESALEEVRLAALGKKGEIALKMRELGQMSPEERMTVAPALNAIRDEVASAIAAKKQALQD